MGSSIMMIATIEEVTAWMFDTGSINFRYFEVFFVGGLVYFVLCQTVNLVRNALGKILFKTAAAGGPW
jgi:polar amino acid transport system permease protein